MTAVPFHILRLPETALQKSVKQMSLAEHVSLSFVSNNTKQLITSLHSEWIISGIILTSSLSFSLYTKSLQCWKFEFQLDQSSVEIRKERNQVPTVLHLPRITSKRWFGNVVHALIQNNPVTLRLKTRGPKNYNMEIFEHIEDMRIDRLEVESFENPDKPIFKLIPSLERLDVCLGHIPRSIFTQNFWLMSLDSKKVTLDDVLISNCLIFSTRSNFLDKELNILMKSCIKGSNPRLREFRFSTWQVVQNRFTEDVLFHGIDYKECEVSYGKTFMVERYDGRQALVHLETCVNFWRFTFVPFFSFYT